VRAVVQRISRGQVTVAGKSVGKVGAGLLVYAAARPDDEPEDIRYIADKTAFLRIFPDEDGKMNRSVLDADGAILLVSAFTVHADARRGRRPSFDRSAAADVAEPLILKLAEGLRAHGLKVEAGRFATHMLVESINDGPVCVLLDSRGGL